MTPGHHQQCECTAKSVQWRPRYNWRESRGPIQKAAQKRRREAAWQKGEAQSRHVGGRLRTKYLRACYRETSYSSTGTQRDDALRVGGKE